MAKTPEELALERRTRKRSQEAIAETERSLKAIARQSSGVKSLLTGVGANVTADPVTPEMNRDVDVMAGLPKGLYSRIKSLITTRKVLDDPDRTDEQKRKFIEDNNFRLRARNYLNENKKKERGTGINVGRETINVSDLYS